MCDEESATLKTIKNIPSGDEQNYSINPGNKTCRACLTQNSDMLFLFPDQQWYNNTNPQNELLEMFTSLTALFVNPDDPYPKHICNECRIKLYEAYNFWKMCRDSIEILNKLNDGKIDIDIKEEYDYSLNQCDTQHNNYSINEENELVPNSSFENVLINKNNEFHDYSQGLTTSNVVDTHESYLHNKLEINTEIQGINNVHSIDVHEKMTNCSIPLSNKTNFCEHCNLFFRSVQEYQRHEDENHLVARKCRKCNLAFVTRNEYDKHWKQTHKILKEKVKKPITKFHCPRCDLDFNTMPEYRRHRKDIHPRETYNCRKCQSSFANRSKYEQHLKTLHPNHLCPQCGYATSKKSVFQEHLHKHSDEKLFECTNCDKKFKTYSSLSVHKRTHSGEGPKYPCPYCDKVFVIWSSRFHHVQCNHTPYKKFTCNICSKECGSMFKLKLHVRSIHTGEKPYSCELCSMKFVSKRNLAMHMVTHSDIRKYPCKVCKKQFKLQKHLKQHMVTHSGERKHKCEICEKSFTQAHVLRSHMKTHDKK